MLILSKECSKKQGLTPGRLLLCWQQDKSRVTLAAWTGRICLSGSDILIKTDRVLKSSELKVQRTHTAENISLVPAVYCWIASPMLIFEMWNFALKPLEAQDTQFKAPWKLQKSRFAWMNFFQHYLGENERFIKHESRKQASLALLILRLSLRGNQALTAWLQRNPTFTESCCSERQGHFTERHFAI